MRTLATAGTFMTAGAMVLSLLAVPASASPGASAGAGPAGQAARVNVIVVLRDDARGGQEDVANDHGADVQLVYRHALQGFAASVPEGRLNGLSRDPRVAYVERDQTVQLAAQTIPTGIPRIFADTNAAIDIDGIDDKRVDVDVAIIDTGIDLEHPDLNVVNSVSCFYTSGGRPFDRVTSCGAGGDDDHYHGTHVAGTVGALDNGIGVVGVAPGARLWAVKVLNSQGSGSASNVIAGIDYVAANASQIEVANMSLGGGFSQAENDAVAAAVAKGVVFVVAAGNEAVNAATRSPASEPTAVTVSALADFDGQPGATGSPTCRADEDDTLANFSNFGTIVDITAPGVCILSTYPIEQGSYNTISGTSMASPHVAGAAALLASSRNYGTTRDGADAAAIRNQLVATGNSGWTDESGDGVKEPLLDVRTFTPTLVDTGVTPPPPPPPTGNFTLATSGFKVKGAQQVTLTWSGATTSTVDVRRDGVVITTTSNDGDHTDNIGAKGGATYTYTVCEAGTTTCSNASTVVF